jgi:Calcineurin-like phosphoesterase
MRFSPHTAAGLFAAGALSATPAVALADPAARTTAETRIGLKARGGLSAPVPVAGAPHVVRTPPGLSVGARSSARRRSLVFFAQMTDAQLADEMSPARIEYQRPVSGFTGAWRPHEALGPQTFDSAVRNVNLNRLSRTRSSSGGRAKLDFTLVTGDLSDNHQHNEVRWAVRILEGGRVDPFSGARLSRANRCPGAPADVRRRLNAAVAARQYTGVQDPADYPGRPAAVYGNFYDPERPAAANTPFAALPRHPGLLQRAQRPFSAQGLQTAWYGARGNHDAVAQGFFAGRAGASLATGCRKVMPPPVLQTPSGNPWDAMRAMLRAPGGATWVPPDRARRFVSARAFKRLHGRADQGHGYRMTPRGERRASAGAASYYAWSPKPGLRFVAIDTVAEGGGPDGNIDHPQYRWLKRVLTGARRRDELVLVYGHHSLETMLNRRHDELAGRCGGATTACDADPRRSRPLHVGIGGRASVARLLLSVPNVIAYVNGHEHQHRVSSFFRPGGRSGFWQVTTASHTSWPQQTRQIELLDNADGTLSLVNTVLDTAAPVTPPAPGTAAAGMSEPQLASLSRLLSANVLGATAAGPAAAQGARNVELRLRDPR